MSFSKQVVAIAKVGAALAAVARQAAAVTPILASHLSTQAKLLAEFSRDSLAGGFLQGYVDILEWLKANPFASAAMKQAAQANLMVLEQLIRRHGGTQGNKIDFGALRRQVGLGNRPSFGPGASISGGNFGQQNPMTLPITMGTIK